MARWYQLFLVFLFIVCLSFGSVIRNPFTNAGIGDEGDIPVGSIVRLVDDNIVAPCNQGERPVGAILFVEEVDNAPDLYLVSSSGIVRDAFYAGEIKAGDILVPADNGAVMPYSQDREGDFIIGTAIESGTYGDRKRILINVDYAGRYLSNVIHETQPMAIYQSRAVYQDIDVGDSWADIESVEITVAEGDETMILINASATLSTDFSSWSGFPNNQWGFCYIRVVRNDQIICGSSSAVVGQYTFVYPMGSRFFGGSASLSITSFDEPPAGTHTYTLQYEDSALEIINYKPFGLSIIEVKR